MKFRPKRLRCLEKKINPNLLPENDALRKVITPTNQNMGYDPF